MSRTSTSTSFSNWESWSIDPDRSMFFLKAIRVPYGRSALILQQIRCCNASFIPCFEMSSTLLVISSCKSPSEISQESLMWMNLCRPSGHTNFVILRIYSVFFQLLPRELLTAVVRFFTRICKQSWFFIERHKKKSGLNAPKFNSGSRHNSLLNDSYNIETALISFVPASYSISLFCKNNTILRGVGSYS